MSVNFRSYHIFVKKTMQLSHHLLFPLSVPTLSTSTCPFQLFNITKFILLCIFSVSSLVISFLACRKSLCLLLALLNSSQFQAREATRWLSRVCRKRFKIQSMIFSLTNPRMILRPAALASSGSLSEMYNLRSCTSQFTYQTRTHILTRSLDYWSIQLSLGSICVFWVSYDMASAFVFSFLLLAIACSRNIKHTSEGLCFSTPSSWQIPACSLKISLWSNLLCEVFPVISQTVNLVLV